MDCGEDDLLIDPRSKDVRTAEVPDEDDDDVPVQKRPDRIRRTSSSADRDAHQTDYGTAGVIKGRGAEAKTSAEVGETEMERKRRWRSIYLMYMTMFVSSVTFSICLSSVWPYLEQADSTANYSFLGWIVAAYSLGQFAGNPLFGAWAQKRGSAKLPLVTAVTITAVGNVLYCFAEDFGSGRSKYVLLGARVVIGFGAGSVGVIRSYISQATTAKERATAMSFVSATQAAGFVLGPAFQAAFVPVGYPGALLLPHLHIDVYTCAGWFSALVCVANVTLLLSALKEFNLNEGASPCSLPVHGKLGSRDLDKVAIVSCNLIFFVLTFVFTIMETIGTPFSMIMYSWTHTQAITWNGVIFTALGIECIIILMTIRHAAARLSERSLLLVGFVTVLVGYIVILPWGSDRPDWMTTDINRDSVPATTLHSLLPTHASRHANTTAEPRGCPTAYAWCAYTPRIELWQFVTSNLLVAGGYASAQVMLITLYSRILGPRPQSVAMSLLASCGSLARMFGPIFVSLLFDKFGVRVTFITVAGVVLVAVFGVVLVYRRLVPWAPPSCPPDLPPPPVNNSHPNIQDGGEKQRKPPGLYTTL